MHLKAGDSQLCPDCLCRFLSRTLVSWSAWTASHSVTGWVEGSGVRVPEGQPRLLLALRQLQVDGSPMSRAFGSLGEGTVEATGTPGVPRSEWTLVSL